MCIACEKGYIAIVKYLIEHSVDINKQDNYGSNPLFASCYNGHITMVKYLVEHGTNINTESNIGYNPLFCASHKGYISVVKYLVEHGANIHKINDMVKPHYLLHVIMDIPL